MFVELFCLITCEDAMRLESVKNLKPEEFLRLTRVKLETFKRMEEMIGRAL